ncbi:MAG: manganese-binding lipoprotein MntA [Planctomycetota bacterium]|nr:MAG: manganese-binding lipoprotein MntA [Planctomycetota bacterium]
MEGRATVGRTGAPAGRHGGWRRRWPGPLAAALALLAGVAGACGDGGGPASGEVPGISVQGRRAPLRVVTTIGMLADAARAIGGERVQVQALMGPGVDPHLYKASQSDLELLRSADLIAYVGLHLEGKMTSIFERLRQRRPVVAVGEGLPPERLRAAPGFAGTYDPHIWFDVGLWSEACGVLAAALQALDPAGAEAYRAGLRAYQHELAELQAWVREQIATIPPRRRVLVTAHDAFGYFGRAYGIEVVGLQGISTVSEAGLADVARLVDLLVERELPAIFVESSVSDKGVRAVVAGAAARGHQVRIGGTLYSDALGPEGSGAETYLGMVRHNVRTIVQALRGSSAGDTRGD